jgi:hypothetical protein
MAFLESGSPLNPELGMLQELGIQGQRRAARCAEAAPQQNTDTPTKIADRKYRLALRAAATKIKCFALLADLYLNIKYCIIISASEAGVRYVVISIPINGRRQHQLLVATSY